MRSRIVILAAGLLLALSALADSPRNAIGRVSRSGAQWVITDQRGRRTGAVAARGSRLLGHNRQLCVLGRGGEYLFYDRRGRLVHSADTAELGRIVAISGDVVTAERDSLRITFGPDIHESSRRLLHRPQVADTAAVVGENAAELE